MGKWLLAAGHHHLFHIVAPIVARARGYFEDEGVGECEFLFSGSDSSTIEGMREGKYQVGLDPKPYWVCGAKAQGADLWIVGGWLNSPRYAFMAAKGRGIRSIKDLRGKKVAVREPDGINVRFIRELFRREGLDADRTIQWATLGSSSRHFRQPLFDSGEVDAGLIMLRDVPGMIEEGYPVLADLRQVYPQGYAIRVTAAREDVVRDEPERLTGLLRALIRGYRFMNQRYEETMKIVSQGSYKHDKDMDVSLWEDKYPMFDCIPQDGMVGEVGLRQVIEEEKTKGKLPASFGIKDILLDRFVKEAAASVERRFGTGCE
jgi:ABC-type nitrate/sulfonate/bicarbonate transport system substrate-binding protein